MPKSIQDGGNGKYSSAARQAAIDAGKPDPLRAKQGKDTSTTEDNKKSKKDNKSAEPKKDGEDEKKEEKTDPEPAKE